MTAFRENLFFLLRYSHLAQVSFKLAIQPRPALDSIPPALSSRVLGLQACMCKNLFLNLEILKMSSERHCSSHQHLSC